MWFLAYVKESNQSKAHPLSLFTVLKGGWGEEKMSITQTNKSFQQKCKKKSKCTLANIRNIITQCTKKFW